VGANGYLCFKRKLPAGARLTRRFPCRHHGGCHHSVAAAGGRDQQCLLQPLESVLRLPHPSSGEFCELGPPGGTIWLSAAFVAHLLCSTAALYLALWAVASFLHGGFGTDSPKGVLPLLSPTPVTPMCFSTYALLIAYAPLLLAAANSWMVDLVLLPGKSK
jgi:hypothetical protein